MTEKRWLYFALGVTTVISVGAVTNKLAPAVPAGVALSDTGITFPDGTVQTTAAGPVDPRRAFYATATKYQGGDADGSDGDGAGVCAPGFHFASLWEIFDVSTLRYATDAEGGGGVWRTDDSGHGPPVGAVGWARTGFYSHTALAEGRANCAVWSSSDSGDYGTAYELEEEADSVTGTGNPSDMIAPWDAAFNLCSTTRHVWCVEDYPGAAGS